MSNESNVTGWAYRMRVARRTLQFPRHSEEERARQLGFTMGFYAAEVLEDFHHTLLEFSVLNQRPPSGPEIRQLIALQVKRFRTEPCPAEQHIEELKRKLSPDGNG